MNGNRDRHERYRLPAELIVPHVRRYLTDSGRPVEEFLVQFGFSWRFMRRLIDGDMETIGFTHADALLCAIDEVELWYSEPLLSHYDRILSAPSTKEYHCEQQREHLRRKRASKVAA